MNIDYSRLPEHMRDGFRLYIEKGIPGGSFMDAVLSNDLVDAFARADHINQVCMFDTVAFLVNNAPIGCYGSAEHVSDWIKHRGLAGLSEDA